MRHAHAQWTSALLLLSMCSAFRAEALLLMKLQRDSQNFGNNKYQNWDYEGTYIIEIENKNHIVVEL